MRMAESVPTDALSQHLLSNLLVFAASENDKWNELMQATSCLRADSNKTRSS